MFQFVVLIFAIGLACMVLELFLPGIIVGSVGVACLAVGVVLTYGIYGGTAGSWVLALTIVTLVAFAGAVLRFLPRSWWGKKLILSSTTADPEESHKVDSLGEGAVGRATTMLRPSGYAVFAGITRDVVAEAGLIEIGTEVVVVRMEGSCIYVRPSAANFSQS